MMSVSQITLKVVLCTRVELTCDDQRYVANCPFEFYYFHTKTRIKELHIL